MIHVILFALLGAVANKNKTSKKRPRIIRLCQACTEKNVGVEVVRGRVEHIMIRHPQEHDTPLFRKCKFSTNVSKVGWCGFGWWCRCGGDQLL